MHQEIGRQTSVLAVDPVVAWELAPAPPGMVWEPLDNNDLHNHSQRREPLSKYRFLEKLQDSIGEIYICMSLNTFMLVRGTVRFYPHHPFPRRYKLVPRKTLLGL